MVKFGTRRAACNVVVCLLWSISSQTIAANLLAPAPQPAPLPWLKLEPLPAHIMPTLKPSPPVTLAPPDLLAPLPPLPDIDLSPQSPPADEVIPITMINNSIHVRVIIGGAPLDMLLDTGADMSSIPATFADNLIASGQATELQPVTIMLADGSTTTAREISVKSIRVGRYERTDVHMTVTPDVANPLLGLPVLTSIGKFTIDAENNQLIITEPLPLLPPLPDDFKLD